MATIDAHGFARNDISLAEASTCHWNETDVEAFPEIAYFLGWNPGIAVCQRSTGRTFVRIDGVVFDTTDRVCKSSWHE